MKQTVQEAAKEARMASAETLTALGTHTSLDDFTGLSYDEIAESAFIKGAEWQEKQSSWINVKEQLPDEQKMVLCMMKSNNAIVSGYITVPSGHKPTVLTAPNFEFEDLMDYEPIAWMPMPPLSD